MSEKNTLVLIGNGFDIWQKLNTGYAEFQAYYLKHRNEITKKLKIKSKILRQKDGGARKISDVELIYGDPFRPANLDDDFWHTFEASLGKLDAQRLNLFFGKEKRGLKMMARSVVNANRILKEAFCRWIATIPVDDKDSGLRFDDNCYFINFNYTDTLEKRFGVSEKDITHIHGQASDAESIIVGHAIHPQEPENILYRWGGRFRGLFLIDYILYQTDKHVRDNITLLCLELSSAGINAADIKDIYVLGHSLGDSDLEYFTFLKEVTAKRTDSPEPSSDSDINEKDPLEELNNRIQYIIKTYGKDPSITEPVTPEEKDAIYQKFLAEQQARDSALETAFWKMLQKNNGKKRPGSGSRLFQTGRKYITIKEENQAGSADAAPVKKERISDAKWHITYYSDADKERAEYLMKTLGCTDYELLGSIDEAVEKIGRKL